MNNIEELHREAIEFADQALVVKLRGEEERAKDFLRKAFEKEREAASVIASDVELEPTRSVLHRSAASFALECGEIREAERLISIALSGNPPDEIAEELRDLIEEVHFKRHHEIRGITLDPNEFQFSMSGKAIGFGFANSAQFVDRVTYIEKMVYRIIERLLGQPFRERGRLKKELGEFELYVSTPRPASFAVSFKIGVSTQLRLPGVPGIDFQGVIDEMFECFELFNLVKMELLENRIRDPSYYKNFVGLSRNIAPDGEQIRTVAFTSIREKAKRQVILTTPREQTPLPEPRVVAEEARKVVKVQGSLRYADSRREKESKIEIIDKDGKRHRVRVPEGMMIDIVRPMWEDEVIVTGTREAGAINLQDIIKVE